MRHASTIIPFINCTKSIMIGSNPFICDCNFTVIRVWFHSVSPEERELVSRGGPIECRWKGSVIPIEHDLSAICPEHHYHTDKSLTLTSQKGASHLSDLIDTTQSDLHDPLVTKRSLHTIQTFKTYRNSSIREVFQRTNSRGFGWFRRRN